MDFKYTPEQINVRKSRARILGIRNCAARHGVGGTEILGNNKAGSNETKAHIQNFLDAVRGTAEVNCPFDVGFRVAIACRMAVDSYRLGRTLRWDAGKEEIG